MDASKMTYAWGDESIRANASPPVYLLAATMVRDDSSLDSFKGVKPKSARKLHWRDMTRRLQRESLEAISALDQMTTLVVGLPLPKKKQERGRRKCLERLLPELEKKHVDMLILESRGHQKDKKDVELLLALRRKGLISTIDITHQGAQEEPRLWIPDQLLGAFGDALCDSPGTQSWIKSWGEIKGTIDVLEATI